MKLSSYTVENELSVSKVNWIEVNWIEVKWSEANWSEATVAG